jgi:uncharacterized DUF497 family protein
MLWEWDETKNCSNIRKHGFDFAEAEEMFRGFLLVRPDVREDYGEERWIGIGMIQGRVAFVALAEPSPGSGLTRFGTGTSIFPTSQNREQTFLRMR